MIITEFNNGWGDDVPLRLFEREVRDRYLGSVIQDSSRTVLINSTWYTQDYHHTVMAELARLHVDRIIVISMMDPAIPQLDWYRDVCDDRWGLGYYAGAHEIDAWALVVDRHFEIPMTCDDAGSIDTAFMCLNRKPHWHRRMLYDRLQDLVLLDRGIVTMGDESGSARRVLTDDVAGSALAPNAGVEQYGIANDIMTLGPADLWRRSFLNIVTETVFDVDREWFVSEKIYKPVIGSRPFLVHAPNGAKAWLAHIGLESYVADFADISDHDPGQPDQLPAFLADLAGQSPQYFQHKYLVLASKIAYNKRMFQAHVDRTWHKINQGALCQT